VDLAPAASCQIAVVFHPTAVNLRTGTLSIRTNAGLSTVSLAGTGLVPSPPQLSVPGSITFPAQPLGTRSAGKPVALANKSASLAIVTELTPSGDFSVSDTCTTIAAGATCSPLVYFQPTALGPLTGRLTIRTLKDLDPYVVELTGTGEENRRPILEASLTHVGFGNALIGSVSQVTITLRSIGQVPVAIESILSSGSFLTSHACTVLVPGSSCTVDVTFVPGSPGVQQGVIEIRSNSLASPQRIALSGIGCLVPSPIRARLGSLLCGP
jgi:hypothetical protein